MADHKKEKKLCFVIGPIGSEDSKERTHADWMLEEIILPVMANFPDYRVRRADQDHRPGLIDAQLINDLLTAELVIADLSADNPNAFYEIGIRHMVQKPIIHMQLADETIPFDVSLYRSIKFSLARPSDIRTARENLKRQVEAVHADGYQVENPVTRARGIIKFEEHATPREKVLIEQIENLAQRVTNIEQTNLPLSIQSSSMGGRRETLTRYTIRPKNIAGTQAADKLAELQDRIEKHVPILSIRCNSRVLIVTLLTKYNEMIDRVIDDTANVEFTARRLLGWLPA